MLLKNFNLPTPPPPPKKNMSVKENTATMTYCEFRGTTEEKLDLLNRYCGIRSKI